MGSLAWLPRSCGGVAPPIACGRGSGEDGQARGEVAQMAMAIDTQMAHSGATKASNAAEHGIKWIRGLALMNLGLVALQALSAGFFMSGYGPAGTIHAGVAHALQLGALTQAV